MNESVIFKPKGILHIYEEKTGEVLVHKNMVVENASHIACLALGGDLTSTKVKIASWDSTPIQSYYNMTDMQAILTDTPNKHIVKTYSVNSHSYPAHRSIKFTFRVDAVNSPEFVGKDLREFGLYFNEIMFSRIALEENFIFEDWMTIVGEWTMVFESNNAGYQDFLLNQYKINALWTMNDIDFSELGTPYVTDMIKANDLLTPLNKPMFVSDLWAESGYDLTTDDRIHNDCLVPYYYDGTDYNILYIESGNLEGLNVKNTWSNDLTTLHLGPGFTMWSWFKFKDLFDYTSTNPSDVIIETGEEWIIFSKWKDNDDLNNCAYKMYIEGIDESLGTVALSFKINDNGTIIKLSSNLDITGITDITDVWSLATVVFNTADKKLNTIFYGLIDEVGISPEVFTPNAVKLLWNEGYGNFFVSDWEQYYKESYIS